MSLQISCKRSIKFFYRHIFTVFKLWVYRENIALDFCYQSMNFVKICQMSNSHNCDYQLC